MQNKAILMPPPELFWQGKNIKSPWATWVKSVQVTRDGYR